jgi:hypothetical protein
MVLDDFQPRCLGLAPRLGVFDAQLHPQHLRADGDRLVRDGGNLGALTEAIDDIHLFRDIRELFVAFLAHDAVIPGIHRDDAIAVLLHVPGGEEAGPVPLGRKAYDRKGLRGPEDAPDLVAVVHGAPH